MVNTNLALNNDETGVLIEESSISDNNLKYCTVSLKEIVDRDKRLEAKLFDVEAKQARERVYSNKYGYSSLGGENGLIKDAYYPGRFKRIYCEKKYGEPFFLPSQITEIYPKPEKYISYLTKCDMEELRLKPSTLLLTRSGTIGTISYVSDTLQGDVFSDDVIRVTFKEPFDLGYVYTYLKTKTGNLIITTNGYGSVITHLEPEHLNGIPIPSAPRKMKERINSLISESYVKRDESNRLLDKARSLLVKELHFPELDDFTVDQFDHNATVNNYDIKLSDLLGRIDASYHVPIVDTIVNHMKQYASEVTTVGDKRISKQVILPGRFKRVYVEEAYGRVFIGGKQIYELDPTNKKFLSLIHHGERIRDQLELHENMTLITCSGTIGKVILVGKHWENWTANQHIIRIIPSNKEIAGYISVFLSSEYGHELINRYTYGSVVDEINDDHVRSIPFPLLKDEAMQKEINSLALEANDKRYEAYRLEQAALTIMNEEVLGL